MRQPCGAAFTLEMALASRIVINGRARTSRRPTGSLGGKLAKSDFIDLTSKARQLTVVTRLHASDGSGKAAPVVIELDMTSFCDFGCPECISADVLGVARLSRGRLLDLAREMAEAGVRAVILTGGGEPLRHHAAREVIARLQEVGIAVGMITNGYLLANVPVDVIAEMAWIRVSLDAATAGTFALMRPHPDGPRAFERVLAGIAHAVDAGGRVVSFVSIVRTTGDERVTNIGEIAEAAALAKHLGCAYFNVKAMQNDDHSLFFYEERDREELARQVNLALALAGDGFEVARSGNIDAVLRGDTAQEKSYSRCASAGLRALITPEGMYPCAYHRGNANLRVPVAPSTTPFAQLWQEYRPDHVDPRRDCRFHCARHEANLELEVVLAAPEIGALHATPDTDLFI